MLTPNSVSMARSRLEVRETVIGTRIACSVSTNQRKRSCPCWLSGNRNWKSPARVRKMGIE